MTKIQRVYFRIFIFSISIVFLSSCFVERINKNCCKKIKNHYTSLHCSDSISLNLDSLLIKLHDNRLVDNHAEWINMRTLNHQISILQFDNYCIDTTGEYQNISLYNCCQGFQLNYVKLPNYISTEAIQQALTNKSIVYKNRKYLKMISSTEIIPINNCELLLLEFDINIFSYDEIQRILNGFKNVILLEK